MSLTLTPWFACRRSMPKRSGWYLVTESRKDLALTHFRYYDTNTPDLFWFSEGVSHRPPNYNCFRPKVCGSYYWRGVTR